MRCMGLAAPRAAGVPPPPPSAAAPPGRDTSTALSLKVWVLISCRMPLQSAHGFAAHLVQSNLRGERHHEPLPQDQARQLITGGTRGTLLARDSRAVNTMKACWWAVGSSATKSTAAAAARLRKSALSGTFSTTCRASAATASRASTQFLHRCVRLQS